MTRRRTTPSSRRIAASKEILPLCPSPISPPTRKREPDTGEQTEQQKTSTVSTKGLLCRPPPNKKRRNGIRTRSHAELCFPYPPCSFLVYPTLDSSLLLPPFPLSHIITPPTPATHPAPSTAHPRPPTQSCGREWPCCRRASAPRHPASCPAPSGSWPRNPTSRPCRPR